MKKYILLIAICSSLLSISCKKEYSCVCTNVPYIGPNGTSGTQITDLGKLRKADAKDACKRIYLHHTSNQHITCEIE